MGKPRRRDRLGWPSGLHATNNARGMYFYYLRPDLPPGHPDRNIKMGYVDKQEAIDAATQLNLHLAPGGDIAQTALAAIHKAHHKVTLQEYIEEFIPNVLLRRRIKGHPLSKSTMAEYRRLYRNICDVCGDKVMVDLTQQDIARLLNQLGTTNEVFNKYRTRMMDLYKHALSDAVVHDNLPARILPKDKEQRVRKRLTLPGELPGEVGIDGIVAYRKIWQQADQATRVAMELMLNVLQRRQEVFRWRFDWSREEPNGRFVYIKISKTRKHGVSSYLRIPETLPTVHSEFGARTLGELLTIADDGIRCPFVVHRRPKRVIDAKEKQHPFQLLAEQITKSFRKARDTAGIYAHLPPEQRPTLHEIISLGQHLRKKQGWTDQHIQALRGHTRISTTQIYLDGHDWSTIEYPTNSAKCDREN